MSAQLAKLLQLVWRSPVFGDSFTGTLSYQDFQQRMSRLHEHFIAAFAPIVEQGSPDLPEQARRALIERTALHVVSFCSVLAIDLDDVPRLTAAAACFGLLYWGDSLMDSGDEAMLHAIRALVQEQERPAGRLSASFEPLPAPASSLVPLIEARLAALRRMTALLAMAVRPEDAGYLLQAPCLNFFGLEVLTQSMSRRYLKQREVFWRTQAETFVDCAITNIQALEDVGLIYALYRQHDPALPPLSEILSADSEIATLHSPINAALRLFDDLGDREADLGQSSWSQFHLNIFNNCDPRVIAALLRRCGFADELLFEQTSQLFQQRTDANDLAIVQLFVALVRTRVHALSEVARQRNALFLALLKRFLETGYVNIIGDIRLAGTNATTTPASV